MLGLRPLLGSESHLEIGVLGPVAGAGKVGCELPGVTAHDVPFQLSQRADFFEEEVGLETTLKRPIINTRDEPHADADLYRRLHVIVGDSNMSETTTLLKVGSADLVLRMLEAGIVMRDMSLENPIRAIREISHDMTCRRTVRLSNGREVSALDIQREVQAGAARVNALAARDHEINAVLIPAAELRRRQGDAGFNAIDVTYTGFFPGSLAALRPLESLLGWAPVGAQYYTLAKA